MAAQPWVVGKREAPRHMVSLKFEIESRTNIKVPELTLEHPENVEILVNGEKVHPVINGYYVDYAIKTFTIPSIHKGNNEIEIKMPFDEDTNLEWCYLLGNFGVEIHGKFSVLTSMPDKLAFGDITYQGLPFYAGNVVYHCDTVLPGGRLFIQTPDFKAPLLTVFLDSKIKENIALAPFIADMGIVEPGVHTIEIISYGNRINAFGPIHNSIKTYKKIGPNAWRMYGNAWSYQYCIKPTGLTREPNVWVEKV